MSDLHYLGYELSFGRRYDFFLAHCEHCKRDTYHFKPDKDFYITIELFKNVELVYARKTDPRFDHLGLKLLIPKDIEDEESKEATDLAGTAIVSIDSFLEDYNVLDVSTRYGVLSKKLRYPILTDYPASRTDFDYPLGYYYYVIAEGSNVLIPLPKEKLEVQMTVEVYKSGGFDEERNFIKKGELLASRGVSITFNGHEMPSISTTAWKLETKQSRKPKL